MKLLLLYSWLLAVTTDLDPLQYVNLFTVKGGHNFPGLFQSTMYMLGELNRHQTGATVPHSMVKVGMDTDSPGNVGHFIFDYQTLRLFQPESRRLRW